MKTTLGRCEAHCLTSISTEKGNQIDAPSPKNIENQTMWEWPLYFDWC